MLQGHQRAVWALVREWVHSDRLMWVMVALCALVPIGMLAWFKGKRWLWAL
jgi:hypothetical protein